MPLPRFHKLEPERRQAILDAASEEFAANGFEGASYNRIIDGAGISKGAMYYYFADKDDLFRTVLDESSRRLIEALKVPKVIPADRNAYWNECESVYRRMLTLLSADANLAALCWSMARARARGRAHQAVIDINTRIVAITEQLVRLGQQVGAIRDDVPSDLVVSVSFGMLEGMDQWLMKHWEEVQQGDVRETSRQMIVFIRGAFAADEEETADDSVA